MSALGKSSEDADQNRLRSPTAEQVFSRREDLEVDSAGTNHDADNPLTAELVGIMAAAAHALGMRKPLAAEKALTGEKAMAVRTHIAHRAMMVKLFHRMKQARQRKS